MNPNYQTIEQTVEEVRKKRGRLGRARVGLACSFALVGLLTAAVLMLPSLDGRGRFFARAVAVTALMGAAAAGLVLAARKRESLDEAARALERVNPGLHNALVSSIQLARVAGAPGPEGAFSPYLYERHLERTAKSLQKIDQAPAAPASSLRPWPLANVILMAVAATLFMLAPARTSQGFAALFADSWTLPEKAKPPALPLTTGDFTIHYQFPDYARIKPVTAQNTNGDVAGLRGAIVTVSTQVLEPLSSASLITSTGERYQMTVDDGRELRATLVLSQPGTYHVEGVDERDRPRSEGGTHRLVVDDDLYPQASMISPIADLEVEAAGTVPVEWEVSDDFGVKQVSLVFQRGGSEQEVALKSVTDDGRTRLRGDSDWNLAEYDFEPGESIPFYIRVTDNDDVSGPKTGKSEVRVLEIYSARKHHRELLARQDELVNRMIDHLSSHLVSLLRAQDHPEDYGKDEADLQHEGDQVLAEVNSLLVAFADDELADELVVEALGNMSDRYARELSARQALMAPGGTLPVKDRDQMKELRATYQAGLEADIIYLDKLVKKQRIDDLLAEAKDLYKAQNDLADLLAQYKKTQDPALLEQLRQAMAELESAFSNLMEQMAKMRKSLPEEFINADAMDQANVNNVADQMEKLRQALADGDLAGAMDMAENFMSQMDKWMSAMQEGAKGFGQMMSQKTMAEMDALREDLRDAIDRQKLVEDELQQLSEAAAQRTQERAEEREAMKDKIKNTLEQVREDLARTQRAYYQLKPGMKDGNPPTPMNNDMSREQGSNAMAIALMRQAAFEIQRSLDNGDLDQAMQQARDLQERMKQVRRKTDDYSDKYQCGPGDREGEYNESWDRTMEEMDEALKQLEQLRQSGKPSLSQAEQARLDQLSREEQAIRQDVDEMSDRYDQMRQDAPSLPEEVSQHMGAGSTDINDASGEMQLGDPARAQTPAASGRGHLESAEQALGEAQSKMQQQMMPGGMGMGGGQVGGGPGGPGRRGDDGLHDPRAEVKIPGEDQYQVPEEYREEILKAMREKSPDSYQNLNHDYYERLVK